MKLPVRVLQVVGIMNYGGAETMIMNLYRNIDRSQVVFDFVVHGDDVGAYDQEIFELGGKIYHCPKYKGYNHLTYVKWWEKFLKNHSEYKVIHGHIRSVAAIYLLIAKKYGRITIAHSHSTSNGHGISSLIKNIMQYPIRYIADYLFACSKEAGEWLFGRKKIKENNYIEFPNAIDVDKFQFDEKLRNRTREQLMIEDKFVVGHVGRMMDAKNHMFLLEIFTEILKREPHAILILVGDGPLRKEIEKKCVALSIREKVYFVGTTSTPESLYQAMDIFVFPSLWEGLGIAVIEAQAAGLECIVSDAIPTQADMKSGLFRKVSLNTSVSKWAEIILEARKYERISQIENLQKCGYDMKVWALKITEFYIEQNANTCG